MLTTTNTTVEVEFQASYYLIIHSVWLYWTNSQSFSLPAVLHEKLIICGGNHGSCTSPRTYPINLTHFENF